MTPSGVERDLYKSPYNITVDYSNGHSITYVFSTPYSKDRFEIQLEENRKAISESLTNRFRMKFYISDDFCDITLYRKIERRGFHIIRDGRVTEWLGKLEYNGQRVIERM